MVSEGRLTSKDGEDEAIGEGMKEAIPGSGVGLTKVQIQKSNVVWRWGGARHEGRDLLQ